MKTRTTSLWVMSLFLFSVLFFGCNTELRRARSLNQKKDYQQAATFYERALRNNPEDLESLREVAQIYCERLKNKGLRCMQKSAILFDRYPDDATVKKWYRKALFENAMDIYYQKELKQARKYLSSYAKFDPENAKVQFMLGDIAFRLNRKPPHDYKELTKALKFFKVAIKNAKPTDKVAVLKKSDKRFIHYDASMKSAGILEMFITRDKKTYGKKLKKWDRAVRRWRVGGKKGEKPTKPKFELNETYFTGGLGHYERARSVKVANKFDRAMPYIMTGLFHAKYKKDYLKAVKFLKKAKAQDTHNMNATGNLKMIYDRLKEKARKAGNSAKASRYEKLSNKYGSEMATLRGAR